jgi:3-methyladenine DNA glycosylase AlkD
MDVDAAVERTRKQVRALPRKKVPAVREIRKALSAELRKVEAPDVAAIGEALAKDEPRWLGYEVITRHRAALASLGRRDIERMAVLDSWYAVDAFGLYISGPAWRDGQIGLADVTRWARAKDFWWRRAALVSTVPLNAKSRGNGFRTEDTLAIAALLVDDREDMVVKALSWALRVLAGRDPKAVRAFLARHDERLAARVKRETNTKLRTGRKNKPKANG